MGGLYANQGLYDELCKLGRIDRFPQVGESMAETYLTLAIHTTSSGHVQCILCLDVLGDGERTVLSKLLAAYPLGMQDLAYADAMLVGLKLGVSIRRADPARGWLIDPCDGGDRAEDKRIITTGA